MTRAVARVGAAVLLLSAPPRSAAAQARGQLRADLLLGDRVAAHAGAGLEVDAGLYARVAVVGAAGAVAGGGGAASDGAAGASARGEVVARFVMDPLRQSRRGPYVGGGVGVRHDAHGDTRGYLLAVLGVEGRRRGGWAPSLELGVGGGARLGVVLRRARPDAR